MMGVGKGFTVRRLKWVVAAGILVAVVIGGYYYYQQVKYYPETDDAYVEAHIVNIAPQVTGKVAAIAVQNHEAVKQGQLLFTIEPDQYQYALEKARANVKLEEAQVVSSQQAIAAAKAKVVEAQANLFIAESDAKRILELVAEKQAAPQEGDQAEGRLRAAKASVLAAKAAVLQANADLGIEKAQVLAAKADEKMAALNLQHTRITAPTSGVISNFTLRAGAMAVAGQALFAIVDTSHWWVDANYKETDMNRIQSGQLAYISIDMYPGHVFTGRVDGISRGSGTTFSLLPAENATGNWVKVTQRFPVKIVIPTDQLQAQYPLRVGASVNVSIDTVKA